MTNTSTRSLPLNPLESDVEQRRLWIGNLDSRVTEFVLLKLLQQHGKIEKFDLLYHRSGPLEGKPRGYAFVTYSKSCDAHSAMDKLNGKLLGSRPLCLKWAYNMSKNDSDIKEKPILQISALTGAKCEEKLSKSSTIQAIEAKLKIMETTKPVLSFDGVCKPGTSQTEPINRRKQKMVLKMKPNIKLHESTCKPKYK